MPIIQVYVLPCSQAPALMESLGVVIMPEFIGGFHDETLPQASRLEALSSGLLYSAILGVTRRNQLSFGSFGKPLLSSLEGPSFNMSHGGGLAVLAVANEAYEDSIGVDVEAVGEYVSDAAHRVFSKDQCDWIESDSGQSPYRFALLWTRLEATLKAEGAGFAIDPREAQLPSGWKTATEPYGGCLITCAARQEPLVRMQVLGTKAVR